MPAELFDPASRPAPVGARRRLTVTTSIAIHAAVIVLIVVLPLAGGVLLPSAMSRIDAFIAPAALPPAPAVQPPAAPQAVPAVDPDAAPLRAPDTIAPELSAPIPGLPVVPGALAVSPGSALPGASLPGAMGELAKPPEPGRREPVKPGGKVKFPKRVHYVPPVYPLIAQTARVEGTVILEAIIDESGGLTNLRVLRSIPLLDNAAKEAVSQWRYSPTTLNGVTVPIIVTVTVTFKLQ